MKLFVCGLHSYFLTVAPLVGAWIEIVDAEDITGTTIVAPLVGAWIEIETNAKTSETNSSLLSWERGLKYKSQCLTCNASPVAPLVGAWIEIILNSSFSTASKRRSSRGSVD